MRKRRTVRDAVEILRRRYPVKTEEERAEMEDIRANDEIARRIYELRTKSRLSQRELALLVGTKASVICRLEDADYRGHSLAMLRRIAQALNRRIEIRFITIKEKRQAA